LNFFLLFILELQLRLKSEVSETEERKNAQIEDIRFQVFKVIFTCLYF
jgi:hypothetical protein